MPVRPTYFFAAKLARDRRLSFVAEMRRLVPEAEWFLVGGAVRDLLLGRPTKDLDLVVRNAPLDRIAAELAAFGSVNLVGREFGVLKFRAHGTESSIDIAWPRTERAGMSGAYRDFAVQSDPALPIEDDLARRDLTVNAMAWSFADRRLVDPFGGRRDLRMRSLRAVGDPQQRFAEDYSRMLRAVRFACQLGFRIETATWDAIKRLAYHLEDSRDVDGAAQRIVPHETAAKELVKALVADPARALDLLDESGMLALLLPECLAMRGCAQSKDHHSEGDVWAHTRLALRSLRSKGFRAMFPGETAVPETVFATLFHDIAKPQTSQVREGKITFYGHPDRGAVIAKEAASRLKLQSVEGGDIDSERLAWLVKFHLVPLTLDLSVVKPSTLAKYFLVDPARGRQLLHLAYADAASSLRPDGKPELASLRLLLREVDALMKRFGGAAPERFLSGEDVMDVLGIPPGPRVGEILAQVDEAVIDGVVRTREEALALVQTLARRPVGE
jgi:tRNA nucleotidyltransferase/poly(A) polymerase